MTGSSVGSERGPVSRGLRRVRALLPVRADFVAMTRNPRRDLLAGLTVAIVALPLALGFGVSSGLGAEAGLATAVVAGALAAVFGGSNLQVSGPTGAMTVVLVPIVAEHGPGGVLTVGLMAGALLIGLALLRAGRSMRYVPAPVVEGFTFGIAGVIALQQVPNALGVTAPEGDRVLVVAWRAVQEFAAHPDVTALSVSVGVAGLMLLGRGGSPRSRSRWSRWRSRRWWCRCSTWAPSRSGRCRPGCPLLRWGSWMCRRWVRWWPRRSRWRPWRRWSRCCRRRWRTG
ncbi:Sulfate permease family protein [Streptomyces sp. CA-256286]|nr:Sulfate permease family protein [Streptomyces sp. CA-256286]